MNNEDFEELLKNANLNKKEFATLVEMNYTSVTNWAGNNNVPKWVKSWLENYIQMRKFETIKKTLRDSGVCEE